MNLKDLGDLIADVAPTIGGAIAGPGGAAAGTAVSLIAGMFGCGTDPEEMVEKIKADPEAALKLAKLEKDHAAKMRELEIEEKIVQMVEQRKVTEAELQDKQQARETHKHSVMPAVIVVMLTAIGAGLLAAIFTIPLEETNRGLAMMMFGHVFAMWTASISYFVGTTRSSAEKNHAIHTMKRGA